MFDHVKNQKSLFAATVQPQLVDVPPLRFIMLDGCGSPQSPGFQDAVGALYGACYTIKFLPKQRGLALPEGFEEFKVAPLEGLWGVQGGQSFYFGLDPESWEWTVMIPQPPFVSPPVLDWARGEVLRKKGNVAAGKLRLEEFAEGRCVQLLHVGPYADEPRSIDLMDHFAQEQGLRFTGKHHEIYLSDPRRTAPEKLKTILRHPVC